MEPRSSATEAARRYENVDEFEREAVSAWSAFEGAAGAFHDNAGARVSLVSSGTIGSWDVRRFRPNIVLDGEGEDALVGSTVTVGKAMLDVGMRIERCVMTTRAQAGGVDRDLVVLRTIALERDASSPSERSSVVPARYVSETRSALAESSAFQRNLTCITRL